MRMAASKPVRRGGLPLLCALFLLGGCTPTVSPETQASYVSAVATPLYVALKVPVCAATLVMAAPLGALQGLAAPGQQGSLQPDLRPSLDAGIVDNCGPPYVLPAY